MADSGRKPFETPVREFHEAFGLPAPSHAQKPSSDEVRLRLRLVREEWEEVQYELATFAREMDRGVPVSQRLDRLRLLLKELCDLRYVVEGTAVAFGLDLETAYREVHRSNMSKLGPDGVPVIKNGKVMKGLHYSPADMHLALPDPIDGEEVL